MTCSGDNSLNASYLSTSIKTLAQMTSSDTTDLETLLLRCMHCNSSEQLEQFCAKNLLNIIACADNERKSKEVGILTMSWRVFHQYLRSAFRAARLSEQAVARRSYGGFARG